MNHTDNQQSHWSSPCMCCVTPRGFTDITECKLVYDRRPWCAERAREADTVASLGHKVSELGGGKRRNLFGWGPQNLKQIWTRATMGAEQSAKRRRLKASVVDISQHKQLRAAAFVPPRRTSFHSPSSFGSPVTMQVLVLLWQVQFVLFAVRMSVVYRRERKKKKKVTKWKRRLSLSAPKRYRAQIANRMKLSFISPSLSSVWKHVCYLLYLQILLHIPHHSSNIFRRFSLNTVLALGVKNAERQRDGLMSRSGQKVFGVTSITGNPPTCRPTKGLNMQLERLIGRCEQDNKSLERIHTVLNTYRLLVYFYCGRYREGGKSTLRKWGQWRGGGEGIRFILGASYK